MKRIKYPYKELTDLERERIELYRSYHIADYNQLYVYYYTEKNLGVGYSIIVSLEKAKKDKFCIYNFGPTAKDITDTDYLVEHI